MASKGFRPPFGLGRVTFLCVAKEKSPKERPPPPSRPPTAGSLASLFGSGGTPQMVHPCTNCGCAVIPDGAPDPLNSPRRLGGGSKQASAPLSHHSIMGKPPLPLGEGWGEGSFRSSANPTTYSKQRLLTNSLNQLRFLSTSSSHASIRALKIAKRQSLSRERAMAAIVASSRIKSSELGAETQGR